MIISKVVGKEFQITEFCLFLSAKQLSVTYKIERGKYKPKQTIILI